MSEPTDAAPDAHGAPAAPTLRVVSVVPSVHAPSAARGAGMSGRSLLNEAQDEVVAGSDHDADRESDHAGAKPSREDDAAAAPESHHDADAQLLLSLTHRETNHSEANAADDTTANDAAEAAPVAQDAATPATADGVEAGAVAEGAEVPEARVGEATGAKQGKRPAKRARAPPKPKAKKAATTKRKAPAAAAETSTGDVVVGETPPQDEQQAPQAEASVEVAAATAPTTTRPSRAAREKRRPPPPPPVQPTPLKKTKTSARPTRAAAAAVTNYVDVTGSDGEDSDVSAVMVISNYKEKARARTPSAPMSAAEVVLPPPKIPTAATVPPARVTKRKLMSQSQFDELLNEDREAGSSSSVLDLSALSDVVLIAAPPVSAPATTPSVPLHPCEFCHKRHSAFPTFVCRSCRRAYHDKCFVEAFKPEIHDNEPIEDQMERLSLYRPGGRSATLRCASCQAAFIDFCKNRGVHWDCNCPTCSTMPHKIADYRRVSLKRIIDEHNLEHAMKKEQKGAAGSKKGATKSVTKVSPAKSATKKSTAPAAAPPTETPVTTTATDSRTRGRVGRRTRGEETPSTEDITMTAASAPEPVADVQDAKSDPKPKRAPRAQPRRVRGKPIPVNLVDDDVSDDVAVHVDAVAMDVDQEGTDVTTQPVQTQTALPNGSNHKAADHLSKEANPTDSKMEDPDDESEENVTYEDLEQRVAITKVDEDTWSFKVACSPSRKVNESGTYKEATLFWHPKKLTSLKCSCCDKIGDSVKWFVQHTDATLLSSLNGNDSRRDIYSYLFVLERNGHMVPLQQVISIIRKKHSDTVGLRQAKQSRQNGGRRSSGPAVKKDLSSSHTEALTVLYDVKFIVKDVEISGPPKRRGSSTPAKYACEVLCAELKWLKPLTANETTLRNLMADYPGVIDTCKKGVFDLCESAKNPKTCKILCECCKKTFNAKEFVHHTRKPLLDAQLEEANRLKEDTSHRRHDEDQDEDDTNNAWDNDKADSVDSASPQESELTGNHNEKRIRAFVCVAGVQLRDPLSAMKLETFLGVLEKLGNQADINKTIAAIVKSQETAVAVSV